MKFIKKYLLGICYCVLSDHVFAQELEALKKDLLSSNGIQKVEQYQNIAILYAEKYAQPDSVIFYSNSALTLSKQLKYEIGILKSQLYISIGFQQKNKFDTSISTLKNVIALSINKKDLLGDMYYSLSNTYYRAGDKKKALENLISAINVYKENSDNNGLISAYCKLADVLESDKQHNESVIYKNKAIELLPKITKPSAKISALNILSSIFFDLRQNSPTNLDSSITLASEAFVLMKEHGYLTKANQILNSISDAYYIKKDYTKALYYCKESLKYREFLLPGEIIISYTKYSDCYNMLGQHKDALNYLDSVRSALNFINVQYYWLGYYQRYYEYNKNAGKILQAFDGLEHYNALRDSLYNTEKSSAINELVRKYEKVENEKKILELSKINEVASLNTKFLIAGVIAAIFAIIVIVIFYRQLALKDKFKITETELRLNRTRINPHFFFNALTSLHSLAMKGKKPEEIGEYIHRFSKIMRESLESSYLELTSLEKEIVFLTNYLELQKLRSSNKFTYNFEIDDRMELEELLIPGMILQPFIENSIEHGFNNMLTGGIINISFELVDKYIKVKIFDNGSGIKKKEETNSYPSRATQIIKDRLLLLNKQQKTKAFFELRNDLNKLGTEIVIHLPIIYRN